MLTSSMCMCFRYHLLDKMANAKKSLRTSDLIENLLKSPSDYKTRMEFMNKDFNADKPRQYEEIRREMASIFQY